MKKALKIISIAIFSLLLSMLTSYYYTRSGLQEMNQEARKEIKRNFAKLTEGTIAYHWLGEETGEVVVLVHGFSIPGFVFDKNVPALVEAGYRVLVFDHFGRGDSDRPAKVYNEDFYDRELLQLFHKLNIEKPVNLVGYSMGGGIATVFAARHPERVKKLALIAPAGFLPPPPFLQKLLFVPYLGEWLITVIAPKMMLHDFAKEYKKGYISKSMLDSHTKQMGYKGYTHALLSSARNFPMRTLKPEYDKLGKQVMPKLLIWGTKDEVVPYMADKVRSSVPKIKLIDIKEGKHSIVYSRSREVNQALLDFFAR
ncbi:MAG: alpha/beta hydrolase [Spirochaetota bacterium]